MTDFQHDKAMALLKTYIEDTLLNHQGITADEDLLMSGLVDSLGVMSLIAFIEKTFSFKIPSEDVVYENFMTLETITTYISGMRTENA